MDWVLLILIVGAYLAWRYSKRKPDDAYIEVTINNLDEAFEEVEPPVETTKSRRGKHEARKGKHEAR